MNLKELNPYFFCVTGSTGECTVINAVSLPHIHQLSDYDEDSIGIQHLGNDVLSNGVLSNQIFTKTDNDTPNKNRQVYYYYN